MVTKTIADQTTEKDLIDRLQQGQQWAFDLLVHRYQDRLLKIAYGITLDHEDSLEVVQDVFVSAFRNIQTFRQDASLATWLRKITVNQCLNWKRKWKRRFRWHHDTLESENNPGLIHANTTGTDPETLIRKKQMENKMMQAIKTLPEKTRAVFVLNTFEGLTYDEIAQTLHIKKGTVSSRLHFARKSLVASMESV